MQRTQRWVTAEFSYNSRLQPLHIAYGTANLPNSSQLALETCPSSGSVANMMHRVYHFGATLNDNGNVLSIDNCRDTARTAQYQYDSMNRITQGNSTGPEWGDTYVVDAWGNLTNMNPISGKTYFQSLQAAAATWKNQLNVTGQVIDAAGNVANDGNGNAYTYDVENRISSTGGWNYYYDGDGNRVKKCTSCTTSTGGTIYWAGSSKDALMESDLAGTIKSEYVFFNGKRVARRDGTSNTPYFYFADHLGSASVVSDSTGAIKNESDYTPYGMEMVISNTVPQNYKFTGKMRDSELGESGLDEFGARYYASTFGRFMTTDWADKPSAVPYANFGNPASLNLYSYVENNPTTTMDLDGHQVEGSGVEGFPTTYMHRTGDDGGVGEAEELYAGIFAGPTIGAGFGEAQQSTAAQNPVTPQSLAAQVPPEAKAAIMNSFNASNAPTADDKKGGFHEESVKWGTDASGNVVVSPSVPGAYAPPGSNPNTIFTPANPATDQKLVTINGFAHIHPKGSADRPFNQFPSPDKDIPFARLSSAINLVVGAKDKKVYFYNGSGVIGKPMKLKDFMGD